MDTSALEAAAQSYKRAADALGVARETLQAEAVAHLRAGVKQAEVARITDWSREYLRRLRDTADKRAAETEVEALRQQVADLQAAQKRPKSAPAAPAPRAQVTQQVREPIELTEEEFRTFADLARSRATPERLQALNTVADRAPEGDADEVVVTEAWRTGLLKASDFA